VKAADQVQAADHDPSGLQRIGELLAAGLTVTDVVHDSRQVSAGSVYVCFPGASFDGHDYAARAVEGGAVAIVCDHEIDGLGATPQIVVDDTRLRVGPIAALLNDHPSRSLTTVGITGTNGKTTTAQLLEAIFTTAGLPTGVVGTLHGPRTTPEAPDLQRTLRGFVDDGMRAAVLEVSSHALALHRVDGTEFDAVVFTNLGRDHLDLHGSQEEYFRAKAMLFDPVFAPLGVINVDDPHGRLLADTAEADGLRIVTVSQDQLADVEVTASSHRYRWRSIDVDVPIGGRFNVANSLIALTTAVELGIEPEVAATGLRSLAAVPGRFEVVRTPESERRGVTVVVDYAHTPDGLTEILGSARAVAADGGDVVVVFGCGGERDRPKRPEMGRIAARLADRVIITSDNPRGESPEEIIDDIVAGVEHDYRARVVTDPDRRAAITTALAGARPGDVVVIAGKGHEATQEFADHTIEFDDRRVAREVLEDES
jgi:UDP-N-acetylmuramoyl-L-alanyl-D-glutamate--2,6-diaminopimelate ligase